MTPSSPMSVARTETFPSGAPPSSLTMPVIRPRPRNCADDTVGTTSNIAAINAAYRLTGLMSLSCSGLRGASPQQQIQIEQCHGLAADVEHSCRERRARDVRGLLIAGAGPVQCDLRVDLERHQRVAQ